MPLVIKPAAIHIKDDNGNFYPQNIVAEKTTEEYVTKVTQEGTKQVTAVNSAGSAQVSAVQNKGDTVLASIPSDYTSLQNDVDSLRDDFILEMDEIPDTVQSYTFVDGTVSQITHNRSGVAVRTDVFTYGTNTITEVRTLSTGESLTIVTNLTTLETTVTYAAA